MANEEKQNPLVPSTGEHISHTKLDGIDYWFKENKEGKFCLENGKWIKME